MCFVDFIITPITYFIIVLFLEWKSNTFRDLYNIYVFAVGFIIPQPGQTFQIIKWGDIELVVIKI